ncbi:MAG: hypothetical protein NT007_09805 [Candidatus Kapabacteria bacterium]|nr:hypothetical protein [Candidatus Kapabacteria bacterium]
MKIIDRQPIQTIEFFIEGTFNSFYEATKWATDNGYSYGSTARNMPIAMYRGNYNISKWYNLSEEEKNNCDGIIISDDFRCGKVTIKIFNEEQK